MWNPDPSELATWQLERDRGATARYAGLLQRKLGRMSTSPLAYLRGSASLFYRLLSEHPELCVGGSGEGWLCGDAHLENFGVYRTDTDRANDPSSDSSAVFDINDFDEAVVGPFRYDVLRLTTSLILGARQLGENGQRATSLASALVDAYVTALSGTALLDTVIPRPVAALVLKAARRSHRDLLDARTAIVGGRRKFIRGLRYADLPESLRQATPAAFERFVQSLPATDRRGERFEIVDTAFRIAGTGSLGVLRIAVLTRGKSEADAGWLFDMKEEGDPSALPIVPKPAMGNAERVLTGLQHCLTRPPRMIGTSELEGTPLFVRRLAPQEDKLDFATVERRDLEPVARYFGTLIGRAHRRGATTQPTTPWTPAERSELVDRSVVLAGIHEGVYLALCKLWARGSVIAPH